MFGAKSKVEEKKKDTTPVKVDDKKPEVKADGKAIDPTPKTAPEAPATPIVQAPLGEVKDKFDLAHLLGKTESGLKTEFYAYQIKELMRSMAKIIPQKSLTVEELENIYKECVKYGADEICVSPYFYQICHNLENKFGKGKIKFGVMVDYPNGESSFKARLTEVKNATHNGLDSVTVVFPSRAFSLGMVGAEKSRLIKLKKAGKRAVGVAISADLNGEQIKKFLKVIDGIKFTHITLLAEGLSVDKIAEALRAISAQKGGKKVYVYSSIKSADEMSALLEYKVDKIYTTELESIGFALTEKFGIKL